MFVIFYLCKNSVEVQVAVNSYNTSKNRKSIITVKFVQLYGTCTSKDMNKIMVKKEINQTGE